MVKIKNNTTCLSCNFSKEEVILHRLILESRFISNPGLLYGKMGIIIAILEYGNYTDNLIISEIGNNKLNEIWESVSEFTPINFAFGLTGIGWGIEYLIQRHLIKGNSIEICEEIDKKIMETDIKRIKDTSLETGLTGILHYILLHIKNCFYQLHELPFDTLYLDNLYHHLIYMQKH